MTEDLKIRTSASDVGGTSGPGGQPRAKIAVRHLDFFYGNSQALRDVSVDFGERRITAIIGPSGCGKSTLLRALNRIYDIYPEQRATGEIDLDGENILAPRFSLSYLRKQVGMVFQKPTPFHLSIFDNIAFPLRHYERLSKLELDERVEQALRQSALWDEVKDILHRSALSLSGGQQQRLSIARTLAVKPEVILMDEPTSALDPVSTNKIEELLGELVREYTVVIVTHNLQQAARVSHRTVFMFTGELIEEGETAELFGHPKHPKTVDYVQGRFG